MKPRLYVYVGTYLLLFAASILPSGCERKAPAADKVVARVPVETLQLAPRLLQPELVVVGELAPWRQVTVAAETTGAVRKLYVDVGDDVKSGARLARLDASRSGYNLKAVHAQREQARLGLAKAKRDLARAKRLVKRGALSVAALESAAANERIFRERLKAAEAQQGLTSRQLRDSRVRAPFAGRVAVKHVELGAFVAAGRPVITLVEVSRLKVKVGFPLSSLEVAKRGTTCRITLPELKNRVLAAKIERVGTMADPRSRRLPVELAIDNAKKRLKPGLTAIVRCPVGAKRTALVIPQEAVVEQFQIPYVFVVEKTQAIKRRVVLAKSDAGDPRSRATQAPSAELEVRSGLRAGEKLVVVGQEGLSAGTPLTLVVEHRRWPPIKRPSP
jgi:membrane fusion protein (multidrug efflux system)